MKRLISAVDKNSIAAEIGIEPADKLVAINGSADFDFFDYYMALSDSTIEILVEKANGEQWLLDVDKDDFEDLGLTFEDGLLDRPLTCRNDCVFCFIQQNPKGILRDSIYFCDDDYRLSYMQGNYITMTNLEERDVNRILAHGMSPLNISVHTTDKNRRAYMMGNRRAGKALRHLERMARGGITLGMQVVLCKGLNDEEHLDKTIYDLSRLVPHGGDGFSLSVVPAGLTKYREENSLAYLPSFTSFDCKSVIAQVEEWQERLLKELGTRFVFLADEFYIGADVDLPPYEAYENFLQLENGVGMMASFRHEFETKRRGWHTPWPPPKISVVTGVAAHEFMSDLVSNIANVDVKVIRNEFFGKNVTVSGLLTGQDIIGQLKGHKLGDTLLLPANCLRHGEEVLLDDVTVSDIEKELGVKVLAVKPTGGDFVKALSG